MEILQSPLSNIQSELLKLYKSNIDEKDLFAIKKLISDYFAEKAIKKADEIWKNEKWDDKKVEELLATKMRTPYHKHSLLDYLLILMYCW